MRKPLGRTDSVTGITHRDFSSDVRAKSQLFRRDVKARRTIKAIAIEQGHRRHLQLCTAGHQYFRQGCAFEKTEG